MADRFKDRYSNHKQDLDKPQNITNTTLAGHVWDLKDQKIDFEIKWEIVCKAAPFSPTSNTCNLCLAEKWINVFKSEYASLNKRQEIFNPCRHKEKQLLVKKV